MIGTAILGVALILCVVALVYLSESWKTERADLLDRIMALSQPIALTMTRSAQDRSEAKIDYLDENREYELSPPVQASWGDDGA